jgi:transformation/transcription domain-associated protein
MSLFDGELQQCTEAMEWLAGVLCELNLHVFQEVWTQKMDFFFSLAQKRPQLLHICSTLFTKEPVSPTLVAIVLKYLIDDLPSLGDTDNMPAAAKIRLYKFAFSAVGAYPTLNEPILATHLSKLIMDCFPLASKAATPTNYFHLLRALFRAIGGGGGRFELLYKEVLPLLPEMLENLNRQLLASEGATREMIVELCLTVPLRLTHLLPHLTYLMQPLTLALRGGAELVNQGLRTLELCIDNLTPDFLDPTLSTVLEDLMDALHSHLKPQPASHVHAHIIIRILGKLGGRNRRLLTKEPSLEFRFDSDPAAASLYFNGSPALIELRSMSALALKVLERPTSSHQAQAHGFIESALSILISQVTVSAWPFIN